jgi:hypothetical protein
LEDVEFYFNTKYLQEWDPIYNISISLGLVEEILSFTVAMVGNGHRKDPST